MSSPNSETILQQRRCELEGCNALATKTSPYCRWHRDEARRVVFCARRQLRARHPESPHVAEVRMCALASCNATASTGSEYCRHHQDKAKRAWKERREEFLAHRQSVAQLREIVALHPGEARDAILREKIMVDALRGHLLDAYELASDRHAMTDNTFIRLWLDASRAYADLVRLDVQLEQGQSVVDLLGGVQLRSADEPDVYGAIQCGLPGFGPPALPEPAPPLERARAQTAAEGLPEGGGGLGRPGAVALCAECQGRRLVGQVLPHFQAPGGPEYWTAHPPWTRESPLAHALSWQAQPPEHDDLVRALAIAAHELQRHIFAKPSTFVEAHDVLGSSASFNRDLDARVRLDTPAHR